MLQATIEKCCPPVAQLGSLHHQQWIFDGVFRLYQLQLITEVFVVVVVETGDGKTGLLFPMRAS